MLKSFLEKVKIQDYTDELDISQKCRRYTGWFKFYKTFCISEEKLTTAKISLSDFAKKELKNSINREIYGEILEELKRIVILNSPTPSIDSSIIIKELANLINMIERYE